MRAIVLLLALLFGLAVPAFADDVATAQGIIRAQEQAFGRDEAAAAYSHAAPEIRQLFPQADIFLQMVQQAYPPVYRHRRFEFGEARAARAGSRSASTSSTPTARRGRHFTRWSSSRTAVGRSRDVRF